jgi:enolase
MDLDGTENKGKLGANAILGVSLAFAKAKAFNLNIPLYKYFKTLLKEFISPLDQGKYVLPVPMMNILNGGKHADSGLDFQEFLIVPVGAPTFSEALRYGSEIFHTLKKILSDRNLETSVGDEGGFAPRLQDNEEAFKVILEAIEQSGYKPGVDIYLAIDAASSSFYHKEDKTYQIKRGNTHDHLSSEELKTYYEHLRTTYPILSMEDPFDEDDWDGFAGLNRAIGKNTQIMGDDLFVTNPKRLAMGIEKQCANSTLIKLNQIGTVTETVEAVMMAMQQHWTTIVSHRSGETEDTTIADLSVGLATGQIKTGSLSRTERIAKYNQLLRIEEKEGKNSSYPGMQAFYNITL